MFCLVSYLQLFEQRIFAVFCNLEVDLLLLKEYLHSEIIEEINCQFDGSNMEARRLSRTGSNQKVHVPIKSPQQN